MDTPNFNKRLLSLAVSAACGLSIIASPQLYAADGANDEIEQVVVTGTRRAGVSPTETLSPVDVIGGGTVSDQAFADLTDSLTRVTPSLNTQRFPIADGTAFIRPVTLRNLSPDQTLVLVNGTRRHRSALVNLQLAPLGTANQGSQGVDFSMFPSAAIERIEILRDGASAQYGSDAIAGVVNIILKDQSEGLFASAQYGSYFEGDGDRLKVAVNGGFELGDDGFVNLTFEHGTSDTTSRGNARPDAAAVAAIVGADLVPFGGLGQRWGDPDVEVDKFFVNAGYDITDSVEFVGNASYASNETRSGFFYRGPVLDPVNMIGARDTLQKDANGDFLPDNADQSLIDSITGAGLTPSDYLVADPLSPSGFVLRNPIFTKFPGGYNPNFGADITDYAVVVGLKGETSAGLGWDVRVRTAENEVEYVISDTINPSLGALSPTTFNPGTLTQEETSLNADFVKLIPMGGLDVNLGFGLEVREETYKIGAGDTASIVAGPTANVFGVGSDGFQGFPLESAGSFDSQSSAIYIDAETDITDQLTGGLAFRYEDFDEFDATFDWKISARYALTEDFAIRATANTGFRAPTPGQVNTLNITTTSDSTGALIPNGTYPVAHPVAVELGAQSLEAEESTSFTLGFVFQATDNTSITADYYNIRIDDRLALQNNNVTQANANNLATGGSLTQAAADRLVGTNANFFVNGFDTRVKGIDLNITSSFDVANGDLTVDLKHSYNKQDISGIKPGTVTASRVFDLENQVPNNRTVLTFDYAKDAMRALVRFNTFGDWETSDGLFGPGDGTDQRSYSGETLVDLELSWTLDDRYTFTVGAENVFDVIPDKEEGGTARFLGVESALTSPFGANGGFWYGRVAANF